MSILMGDNLLQLKKKNDSSKRKMLNIFQFPFLRCRERMIGPESKTEIPLLFFSFCASPQGYFSAASQVVIPTDF